MPLSAATLQVARRRSAAAVLRAAQHRSRTLRRGVASCSTVLNSPAPSVVPATNAGLHSWGESLERSPRIFSSLASPSSQDDPITTDQEILDSDKHDFINDIDMTWLTDLASQSCTPLRLQDMYKYAAGHDTEQRLRNAQFLHKELPIRIAQRAVDLLTLPHGLNETKPIRNVARLYLEYLEKFQATSAPTTPKQEAHFTELLQSLVLDRTAIPTAIASGVRSWKEQASKKESSTQEDMQDMDDALYRFFTARVGLRFLCEHHILSSNTFTQDHQDLLGHIQEKQAEVGCIQTNTDIVKEISQVAEEVKRQTEECYGICPEIDIVDCSESHEEFTYVPHHLQYMAAELLKNSSRATVQRHLALQLETGSTSEKIPPIRVVVAKGAEDVTIKIADRGGGVPRSTMDNIFTFSHSTANANQESKTDFGTNAFTGGATHGFGLPLARIYARYFGGELTLKSMEGYGVDAYLYLPRLGEKCENLPQRVVVSPGALDSNPQSGVSTGTRSFSSSTRSIQ